MLAQISLLYHRQLQWRGNRFPVTNYDHKTCLYVFKLMLVRGEGLWRCERVFNKIRLLPNIAYLFKSSSSEMLPMWIPNYKRSWRRWWWLQTTICEQLVTYKLRQWKDTLPNSNLWSFFVHILVIRYFYHEL